MRQRLGIEEQDVRNMAIVVAFVSFIMFLLLDGAILPRLIASLVLGGISAVVFTVVTVLINAVKPDYR
jgi:hypothetical protein